VNLQAVLTFSGFVENSQKWSFVPGLGVNDACYLAV
jgi:hypothetical protein